MNDDFTMRGFVFCPQCGSRNGKAVTQKLFVCDDCDFRFYANPAAAVAVILPNERGEVLFVRRMKEPAKGKLNIPGGFVDPYESLEEAVCRETQEEINAQLDSMEFLASFPNLYTYRGVTYHTTDAFFVARVSQEIGFVPNDEVSQIVFLAPQEVDMNEIAFESTRRALYAYFRRLGILGLD